MSVSIYWGFKDPGNNWDYVEELPEINLCNRNMEIVLEWLGYHQPPCEITPIPLQDFMDRVVGALHRIACVPKEEMGFKTSVDKGGKGMTIIDCGLRDNYVQEKLTLIVKTACDAEFTKATHVYFG